MSLMPSVSDTIDKVAERAGKALPVVVNTVVQIILDKLCEYEVVVDGWYSGDKKVTLRKRR